MTNQPREWMLRVKSVEKEYRVAQTATDRFLSEAELDATILSRDIRVRDLTKTIQELEGTYIIRMFAEFETCLRKFWNRNRPPQDKKHTPAEVLVGRVGSQIRVSENVVEEVHEVREMRNLLIHEREEEIKSLSIAEVRSRLCHFIHYLYRKWT